MAGLGHRAWTPGEIIAANNVQQYLMDQTVQVYANSAARGSALIGFISEGMVSYLKDTNSLEMFNGTDWVPTVANATTTTRGLTFELPTGTTGQYLRSSGTAVAFDTLNMNDIATDFQAKSSSYTIVATDENTFIRVSAAATITVANVLAAGESINFIQTGTGQITFTPGAGVTLLSKDSNRKTNAQYSAATLIAQGSGTFYLVGDLVA
jgi:hypothetical protein